MVSIPPMDPATLKQEEDEITRREELWRLRASAIKLVLTDCDGVLTDGSVYYTEGGEAARRFSVRDGMGVELLRNDGLEVGIVSGENSPIIRSRAEKLNIAILGLGVINKLRFVEDLAVTLGLRWSEIAYIGDDVNDLRLMEAVYWGGGITASPADAIRELRLFVQMRTSATGGGGAFREFADRLLELRGAGVAHSLSTPEKEGI